MALNLIMLGPPGGGKGTQAERFAAARGIPKISTGDILREAVQAGTELGLRAKAIMDRGELVERRGDDRDRPRAARSARTPRSGFVLDGFPRTVAQAEALDGIMAGRDPLIVVDIVVPEAELVRRLTLAADLRECGSNAPEGAPVEPRAGARAAECGGKLVQRADDNEAVVRERLKVYHAEARSRSSSTTARGRRSGRSTARSRRTGWRALAADRRRCDAGARPGRCRAEVRPVIVCRSAAELERMREAGRLVGEVLTELAAHVAPGVTTADLDALAEKTHRAGGRDAGVQGLSRVSGDDLRVDQRRGDSRHPVGPPGAERGRRHLDRRRRVARRVLRRQRDHAAGRARCRRRRRRCCA